MENELFKAGERVRVVELWNSDKENGLKVGMVGKIVRVVGAIRCIVDFGELKFIPKGCNHVVSDGYIMNAGQLEHVEPYYRADPITEALAELRAATEELRLARYAHTQSQEAQTLAYRRYTAADEAVSAAKTKLLEVATK